MDLIAGFRDYGGFRRSAKSMVAGRMVITAVITVGRANGSTSAGHTAN